MATLAQVDLQKLWDQVVSSVSTPQYSAFLVRTKPLGLLPGEGDEGSNLLLSAPDLFTKDVLETRLRAILTEELTNQFGEKINIAVTVTADSKTDSYEDSSTDQVENLIETYSGLDYISLYDHNDKYCYPMYNDLSSKIIVTQQHHWRTTPSTCGSFIISRETFEKDLDIWTTTVGDHNTFLWLNENRERFVFTPIPGLSTHCMEGLMSPTIDWKQINKNKDEYK